MSISAIYGEAILGYQWNYRSGINLTLAGGAIAYSTKSTQGYSSTNGGTVLADVPTFKGLGPVLVFNLGIVI